MPMTRGSAFAPAPAWCSSTRRWSTKGPGSRAASRTDSPTRLNREGFRQYRRGGRDRKPLARQRQHHAFAAGVGGAVDLAVADQNAGHAESSPCPGLRSMPRCRSPSSTCGREFGHFTLEAGPARDEVGRGECLRHRSCSSRPPRPATWRRKRGSNCRRPTRSRRRTCRRVVSRIAGIIDERGRLPAATALATGRPCSSTGENEKSVSWLLRKNPSTIRPVPKMLSTVVVMETTLPSASRTIRCDVPVGSSVRSAPATRAPAGTPGDRRRTGGCADQPRALRRHRPDRSAR